MRSPVPILIVVLLLVWLLAAVGCAGQETQQGRSAPAANSPEPPGVGPAAEADRDEQHGPAAAPGTVTAPTHSEEEELGGLPWHDAVHYCGIAGGMLALLALLVGLVVYSGFELRGKPWGDPTRLKVRRIHMALGVTAIALSLGHYAGRLIQHHELVFETKPPFLCAYGFALLLISGILRYRTPRALRKVWRVFPYLHRLGFVVALYYLTRHSLHQYRHFNPPGG